MMRALNLEVIILIMALMIIGCGDETAFTAKGDGGSSPSSGDSTLEDDVNQPGDDEDLNEDIDNIEVPGTRPDELAALRRCMHKWGGVPFGDEVKNFRRIFASVVVGSSTTAINDTVKTDEPELLLVYAGVNVNSEVTYNFLNPNGYYCIFVNVNVDTQLTVNLHCNAKLADSLVDVIVDSSTTDNTSRIGVHVDSDVEVVSMQPNGESCN